MSEPSKRDRAVESLGRLFRRAALCLDPEPGDVEALVDLLIDAAAERASAEVATPGGPGRCPSCGKPFEWFRPGKSRPTCECWGRDV